MASPFSMLGMLSKARRAASKRISSTDDNNSDSRSIASVSKEDKKAKKQSSKILRALEEKSKEGGKDTLFPTTSSGLTTVVPEATTTSQPFSGKPARTASVGTDELGFSVVPQQATTTIPSESTSVDPFNTITPSGPNSVEPSRTASVGTEELSFSVIPQPTTRTTTPSESPARTASVGTEELGFCVVPQQITTTTITPPIEPTRPSSVKTDQSDFSIGKAQDQEWTAVSGDVEPSNASQLLRPTLAAEIQDLTREKDDLAMRLKAAEEAAAKSRAESEERIQHLLDGNAELNEGNASLLKEADRLLDESKEARERARVLEEDKETLVAELRSLKARHDLLTQEKAKQDEELRLVQEETEDLAAELRALRAEKEELRDEVEAEKQTRVALEEEKAGLATEIRELQAEIDTRDEELETKSSRVSDLEWDSADMKEQMAQLREDLLRTSRRLVEARNGEAEKTTELTNQMRRLHDRFGSTERQNRMLKDQLQSHLDELQSRRADDRQPSSYAVNSATRLKHTSVVTDDAVRIVALLNSEIFQAAACLSDKDFGDRSATVEGHNLEVEALRVKVKEYLGDDMVTVLESVSSHRDGQEFDPWPLQIAFQVCLAYCCNRIITSWYPCHWEYDAFLETLYSRIQGVEEPKAAERWRAITRARLGPSDNRKTQMIEFMCSSLLNILVLSGWSKDCPLTRSIMESFEDKLSIVATLAIRLHVMLGEDRSPERLETLFIPPGTDFDDEFMDNDYAEGNESDDGDEVVCTSDIGLRRVTRDGINVIVKPKVIVPAVLEQMGL
ncbi:smc-domain containing protein [Laccaria bicolor S238N-H82]|uniref:Smc-domain containing protein n=1 Tax=Laccaria bicolor (strain S238N-H82 / ATCC MYA-4686) TaxID=486041 RepID=B0DCA3_LACBS|nr:smc-domain containing protein [Laccaria bicolor S238N-H82]EDR07696.1 smc-domain containing protein [Laccaria bicolor S238N-H82]|eukprot:XP_001881485.1 smc-domain containing protein [Laccaria bicolor S238N-H82]